MMFSFEWRLYSTMTGQLFSSMPSVSIRPSVMLYSDKEAHTKQAVEIALEEGLQRLFQCHGGAADFGDRMSR